MPNTENENITVTPAEDGGAIIEIAEAEGRHVALPAETVPAPAPTETPPQEVIEAEVTPQPPVSEAVEELRSQLKQASDREAAERRERLRAEQQARQFELDAARHQDEARRAQDEVVDSRRSELDAGIAAAHAETDAARRQYEAALAAGDFAAASAANVAVNRAASRLVLLEDRKASFEVPRQTATGRIEAPQPAAPQPAANDPTEQYILNKTPRTQAWLRKHMECVTDTRMNNKAVGAYYEALAEGFVPDTDAYFDFMDRKLGYVQQESSPARANAQRMTENSNEAPPPRRAPKQPPAAPVSRETPRAQELGNGRIYLTKSELDAAEALGLSPAEYGKRKVAMTKQGFYH